MKQYLYDEIVDAMATDDECHMKISRRLTKMYRDGDSERRNLLDVTFVTLCGYSLATLINDSKKIITKNSITQ